MRSYIVKRNHIGSAVKKILQYTRTDKDILLLLVKDKDTVYRLFAVFLYTLTLSYPLTYQITNTNYYKQYYPFIYKYDYYICQLTRDYEFIKLWVQFRVQCPLPPLLLIVKIVMFS